jgi:hypothetical protein
LPKCHRPNYGSRSLTLIYQSDSDALVPLSQSRLFAAEACVVTLNKVRSGGHGWLTMLLNIMAFSNWFDRVPLPGAVSEVQ